MKIFESATLGVMLVTVLGCQHGEEKPRATPPSASVVTAHEMPPAPAPKPSAAATAPPSPQDAGVDAEVDAGRATSARPVLTDADGGTLPQTEARPSTDSAFFKELSSALFRAIQEDDPSLAHPYFFPLLAYRQVKNIAKPDRDYARRLLANFDRDIHEYHKKLGAKATDARLLGLEVPEERARWMKPGSEGNKLGYFRVLRSRLRYADAEGKEHSLEITSLISWRGEWYVVHVHGFS